MADKRDGERKTFEMLILKVSLIIIESSTA
jgi:hypothetical protein